MLKLTAVKGLEFNVRWARDNLSCPIIIAIRKDLLSFDHHGKRRHVQNVPFFGSEDGNLLEHTHFGGENRTTPSGTIACVLRSEICA